MRKLLAGVIGVVAMGLLATAAFAGNGNTVWLCNGQFITGTGNNRCLIVSENLETVRLQDMAEDASVECAVGDVLDEEWVGPGSEDETTEIQFKEAATNCKPSPKELTLNLEGKEVTNVCSKVNGVKALNLPYKTLIYLEGTTVREILLAGTSGKEPGFAVECTVAGINIKDECLTKEPADDGHFILDPLAAEGAVPALVDLLFLPTLLKGSEAAKCSLGGEESGLTEGEVLLAAKQGNTIVALEVSEE